MASITRGTLSLSIRGLWTLAILVGLSQSGRGLHTDDHKTLGKRGGALDLDATCNTWSDKITTAEDTVQAMGSAAVASVSQITTPFQNLMNPIQQFEALQWSQNQRRIYMAANTTFNLDLTMLAFQSPVKARDQRMNQVATNLGRLALFRGQSFVPIPVYCNDDFLWPAQDQPPPPPPNDIEDEPAPDPTPHVYYDHVHQGVATPPMLKCYDAPTMSAYTLTAQVQPDGSIVPDRIVFCPRFLEWMQPDSQIDVLYQNQEDISPGNSLDALVLTSLAGMLSFQLLHSTQFGNLADQSLSNGQMAWTLPDCVQLKEQLPDNAPNNPYSLVLFMIATYLDKRAWYTGYPTVVH